MSRVVVIGAGVGGLAAAARLAAAGHEVTVCEQADDGRRQARPVRDDTAAGSSASTPGRRLLTLPQVFPDLFAATGGRLDGTWT